MTKLFKQLGGGIFIEAFKGTLGVMAGMFVYWSLVLLCIVGFVGGVVLFVQAKNETCIKKENKPVTRTQRRNGRTETVTNVEEVCVEEKSINDASTNTKAKYYSGIVMMIIFGIILLIVFLPYIIAGLGRAIGWYMGERFMG